MQVLWHFATAGAAQTGVAVAAWLVLLVVAAWQVWMYRNGMSPDGVAYLDLSDAVAGGRTDVRLVNAYWSPVFPVLIGIGRLAARAVGAGGPAHEFAVVHVVNLAAFVASLAAFEWLLREVRRQREMWGLPPQRAGARLLAYVLFGTVSLAQLSLAATTPDMVVCAIVLAIFACLLRLDRAPAAGVSVGLGMLLAAGALTKSFLFPLDVVILIATALWFRKRGVGRVVVPAAVTLVVLTTPWCVAVSRAVGHPSVGETGSLNFAWYVNGTQPPNSGVMPALSFPDEPLPLDGIAIVHGAGTNPLWYDPASWHRDVHPEFAPKRQAERVWNSVRYYAYILAPLFLAAAMIAAASPLADSRAAVRRAFLVLAPSAAAFVAYGLVYTTSRFLAPFIAASGVLTAAAMPANGRAKPGRTAIAAALMLLAIAGASPLRSRVLLTYAMALFLACWFGWGMRIAAGPKRLLVALATAGVAFLLLAQLSTAVVLAAVPIVLAPVFWIALSLLPETERSVRATIVAAAVVTFAIPGVASSVSAVLHGPIDAPAAAEAPWTTAQRMIRGGLPEGSAVAVIGNPDAAPWLRLARYHVVGVVPQSRADAFRALGASDRRRVLQAFARAGARRVIDLGVAQPARPENPDQRPLP